MKKRFKMYKAGKHWVVAPLVFLGVSLGITLGVKTVAADENTTTTSVSQVEVATNQGENKISVPATNSSQAVDTENTVKANQESSTVEPNAN